MEEMHLQELGLSRNEARLYLELLKHGSATAATVAKNTRIHRATTYADLSTLIERGLVSYVIRNYTRYYQAAPPEKLHEMIASKLSIVDALVPELKSLHQRAEQAKIEVFEGKEGVKTYFKDILMSGEKELLAFGVTGSSFELLKLVYPHFLRDYIKSGIKARLIANPVAEKRLSVLPKKSFRVKYVPEEFASNTATHIYSDRVAIQSMADGNTYIIIIKDKSLSNAYRKYFELMWRCLDTEHHSPALHIAGDHRTNMN